MITNLLIGKGVTAYLQEPGPEWNWTIPNDQTILFHRRWYPKEDVRVISQRFNTIDSDSTETFDPVTCTEIEYLLKLNERIVRIKIPYDPTRIFELGA